jgi:ELWxxDGT repeat protein
MNRPSPSLRLYCLSVLLITFCALPAGAQPAFLVKDVNTGASSIIPSFEILFGEEALAAHEGALLFAAYDDGSLAPRLWRTDGTEAGTARVSDALNVQDLTPVPGGPVFFKSEGLLFSTDGTPAGTGPISGGPADPHRFAAVPGGVFYYCSDEAVGSELCRSDGTPAGTGLVKDIAPGPDSSFPAQLTPVGDTLFFTAVDEALGLELWKSDGTEAGTVLVKDIWPGGPGNSGWPDRMTAMDGTLFFSAHTPESGRELWKSDGTPEGTVLVKDIQPGNASSILVDTTRLGFTAAVGGTLFFAATDGVTGVELWKSDGTEDGTVLVKDIQAGSLGSGPWALVAVGNRVFFTADDGIHGREVWVTDGTAAGTRLVLDIAPGPINTALPNSLTAVGHVVVFSATDQVHGQEMWRSNGNAAGTWRVDDIAPGALSSSPFHFTPAGSHVFFVANDNTTGFEPWAVPRAHVLATFGDVPTDHWAWPFVEALSAAGLTRGCAPGQPGQYCPGAAVTRADTAVFLVRATRLPFFIPPTATGTVFGDVPAGHWAASWIEQLAADGLTGGCSTTPTLYCPEQSLTRAELAVLLLKAEHGSAYAPPPATGTVFTDVPAGFWAAPWIEQLAAEGITTGCGGGAYCPGNAVNRAEMAVFLTKTFNLPLP